MCRYFCTGFIDFMLKGKSLLDYTIFFFSYDYKKNDKIILKLKLKIKNSITKKMKKLYCVICGKYRKSEKSKISYLLEKNISSFYYLQ